MLYYRNNFITVTVLTNDGPEPQENFTVSLTAATKGVTIDTEGQNALITVSNYNDITKTGFFNSCVTIVL